MSKIISIIVPVYNEEKNIPLISEGLNRIAEMDQKYSYEIIFVNDGSKDNSQKVIDSLVSENAKISYTHIEFSRNFGKEAATSAGLDHATGDAVIMMDADGQHPPSCIPRFIDIWENGAEVVIGIRTKHRGQSNIKAFSSFLYYKIMHVISSTPIEERATDFRLLDRKVVDQFNILTERERITRGLIDWLGFKREYILFEAPERIHGVASYSFVKLVKLAFSSFLSHSLLPLKITGYLGVFIMLTSGLFGVVIFFQRYVFNDVLDWNISGIAQLAILIIFFIGIILSCLGLIALYIGNIHNEVSGRPLYVIKKKK